MLWTPQQFHSNTLATTHNKHHQCTCTGKQHSHFLKKQNKTETVIVAFERTFVSRPVMAQNSASLLQVSEDARSITCMWFVAVVMFTAARVTCERLRLPENGQSVHCTPHETSLHLRSDKTYLRLPPSGSPQSRAGPDLQGVQNVWIKVDIQTLSHFLWAAGEKVRSVVSSASGYDIHTESISCQRSCFICHRASRWPWKRDTRFITDV